MRNTQGRDEDTEIRDTGYGERGRFSPSRRGRPLSKLNTRRPGYFTGETTRTVGAFMERPRDRRGRGRRESGGRLVASPSERLLFSNFLFRQVNFHMLSS